MSSLRHVRYTAQMSIQEYLVYFVLAQITVFLIDQSVLNNTAIFQSSRPSLLLYLWLNYREIVYVLVGPIGLTIPISIVNRFRIDHRVGETQNLLQAKEQELATAQAAHAELKATQEQTKEDLATEQAAHAELKAIQEQTKEDLATAQTAHAELEATQNHNKQEHIEKTQEWEKRRLAKDSAYHDLQKDYHKIIQKSLETDRQCDRMAHELDTLRQLLKTHFDAQHSSPRSTVRNITPPPLQSDHSDVSDSVTNTPQQVWDSCHPFRLDSNQDTPVDLINPLYLQHELEFSLKGSEISHQYRVNVYPSTASPALSSVSPPTHANTLAQQIERLIASLDKQKLKARSLEKTAQNLDAANDQYRVRLAKCRWQYIYWRISASQKKVRNTLLTAENTQLRMQIKYRNEEKAVMIQNVYSNRQPILFLAQISQKDPSFSSGSSPVSCAINQVTIASIGSIDQSIHSFDYLVNREGRHCYARCSTIIENLTYAFWGDAAQLCFIADGESGTGKSYSTFQSRTSTARVILFFVLRNTQNGKRSPRIALTEWYAEANSPQKAIAHDRLQDLPINPGYSLTPLTQVVDRITGETWYTLKPQSDPNAVDHNAWKQIVDGFFDAALQRRKIATTSLNTESSRGHLVFSVVTPEIDGTDRESTIMVVDLAGSELGMEENARDRLDPESAFIHASRLAIHQQTRAFAEGKLVTRDPKSIRALEDCLKSPQPTKMVYMMHLSMGVANVTATRQGLSRVQELQVLQKRKMAK